MELGIYSFVETRRDAKSGQPFELETTFADMLEQGEVADKFGLDVFGLGEHHRPDYAVSAPAVALAAVAARTKRIKLSSAVTVLSSDDPVRVYQQFATLDLISNRRAEIMVGRGSFIESYPLFGQSLNDYDELFSEKLDLLLKIRADTQVTWSGKHRSALQGLGVYPRTRADLPIWIAVGGTPQSAVRAGTLGLPLALAIIGGDPIRFSPFADLYRQALAQSGREETQGKLSINGHGFIAPTKQQAVDAFFPTYAEAMTRIGRERGWPPLSLAQFEAGIGPEGHLFVGTPDDVIAKIKRLKAHFPLDRYVMQMHVGPVDQKALLKSIELFATAVRPAVQG
jgi:probable LLM family oxidoreductase